MFWDRFVSAKSIKIGLRAFYRTKKEKADYLQTNFLKFLQETQTKTYKLKDQQFQTYTWEGNDTTILLVHGWESNASR